MTLNDTEPWVEVELDGYAFLRPRAALPLSSESLTVTQFASLNQALVISTYRRPMPLDGPLGLEAACGSLADRYEQAGGIDEIGRDGSDDWFQVTFRADTMRSSRVVVRSARLQDGDVAIIQVVLPDAAPERDHALAMEVARSLAPSA